MARRYSKNRDRNSDDGGVVSGSVASTERPWLMSQERGLRLLVFVAGFVLMALEIAGSRVLAPHFGNSVFVWGSLISVVLIALSIGYYAGGVLVDRRPSLRLLNAICILASAWIFALASAGYRIGAGLAESGLGAQWGPLVASAILFLPPSIALGMVSPFSVRIAAKSIQSMGQISGTLYAVSTVGSIAGTLLTTFSLIPAIGVTGILRILALLMLAASLVTLPMRKRIASNLPLLFAAAVMVGSLMIPANAQTIRLGPQEIILSDEDTPYHHIVVTDNGLNHTRELRFDKDVESGIFLREGYPTSIVYPDYFHLAFLARPKMERILFIGAGGGIGPRTFLARDHALQIEVVDIDRRVLALAQEHFFMPDSPAIQLVAQDGRMFLRETTNTYDCIVLDAFTAGGRIPFHLVTRECLQLCRERLKPNGLFIVNMGSALEGPISEVFRSMYRTIADVFPTVYVFALDYHAMEKTQMTNIIVLASNEARQITEAEWLSRAKQYDASPNRLVPSMEKLVADRVPVAAPDPSAPIFTDDYAPIETMPK